MLAVNYSTLRNSLKSYCDKATDDGEIIIATRKGEKNIVIMSLEQFNEMQKRINNEQYIKMLENSIAELKSGKIIVKNLSDFEWIML